MRVSDRRGGRGQSGGRDEQSRRGDLNTLQKVAVLMMVLDEDRTQKVIGRLEEDEIRRVSRAMANLGKAEVDTVEKTISEFRNEVGRTGNVFGTIETTERLLKRMLPGDKVSEIMDEIRGPEGRNMWEKLGNMSAEVLATYLKNEYPQTAAVIISKLPPQHAAKVLRLLPEKLVSEISLRLVRMDSIQRNVLNNIEETLKKEFITNVARGYERDNASIMAELLNRSDKDVVERIMRHLEEREPSAASRIRRIMFTFEDLARIDRPTFPVLVNECPGERLAIALSGATEEMRELFFSSMSDRAADMLRENLETAGPQRRKNVEDAQADIIAIAKRLAEEGKIVILEEDETAEL